jgi:epoxyqueuosine reductase
MTLTTSMLSQNIRSTAAEIGLDAIGFAEATPFADYRLPESVRRDPRLTLPAARSLVVAGVYIGGLTLPAWDNPAYGRTSRLYLSGFFLDVTAPLKPLAELLQTEGYRAVICDGTVDGGSTLPLKLAAIKAGLGWQGKHSLLISKKFGTFLALGGILTDAVLEPYAGEEKNRCGDCRLCQEACPLGALEQPFVLDQKRCLSNLLQTEVLPPEAQAAMENLVGDCEICQQACPWNRKHIENPLDTPTTRAFRKNRADWEDFFRLSHLADLTASEYDRRLGPLGTGIAYAFFRRNVASVIQNQGAGR